MNFLRVRDYCRGDGSRNILRVWYSEWLKEYRNSRNCREVVYMYLVIVVVCLKFE